MAATTQASRRSRRESRRRDSGFTLVEVLVALLVMAVLSTMAWQGIDGIVRARDISQAQMERTLRLNTVMAQWDQDLMSVHDTTAVPALAFDGATIRLVREAQGGVQIVAWSLQGTQWRRWAGPVVTRVSELQESWMRSQQLLGNEPGQLALARQRHEVQVLLLSRQRLEQCAIQWRRSPACPAGQRCAATRIVAFRRAAGAGLRRSAPDARSDSRAAMP